MTTESVVIGRRSARHAAIRSRSGRPRTCAYHPLRNPAELKRRLRNAAEATLFSSLRMKPRCCVGAQWEEPVGRWSDYSVCLGPEDAELIRPSGRRFDGNLEAGARV